MEGAKQALLLWRDALTLCRPWRKGRLLVVLVGRTHRPHQLLPGRISPSHSRRSHFVHRAEAQEANGASLQSGARHVGHERVGPAIALEMRF